MAEPLQSLLFQVAGPRSGEVAVATLRWTAGGESREVELHDDGRIAADLAYDGVWSAEAVGPPIREFEARLTLYDLDGAAHIVWEGPVPVADHRSAVVAWQIGSTEPWQARLVSAAWPGNAMYIPEAVSLYVGAAWTALCFVVVAALVHVTRREGVGF